MKKLFVVLLMVSQLYGWETTTHRAIDRTALDSVSNLNKFIRDSNLENEDYENEIYGKFRGQELNPK